MEALGCANAAVPFMSSIILGAEAFRLAGSEAQKAAWLPKLASGDAIATFAYAEGPGSAFATGATLDGGQMSGSQLSVADGGIAVIAAALVHGGGFTLVDTNQPGVMRMSCHLLRLLPPTVLHYRAQRTTELHQGAEPS